MEKEFKPFHETYKLITFSMCINMIYPNPATDKWRLVAIPISIAIIIPVSCMIFIDVYKSWLENDIVNIIRHSTVLGPFLGGLFKMILMYHKRVEAKEILDEINRDYETYNSFTGEYRAIAAAGIRNSLIYSERGWAITIIICVMTFPAMAVVLNMYNFTSKWDADKFMIHDLNKPFAEPEERFESPYYEIMIVYMLYGVVMYVVNFIGYDGFFGLSVNHACMKIDLFCKAMEDAMKAEPERRRELVVKVIEEHCKMYKFVDLIQDTFNIWLGLIFLATMIQICNCLYHITEGYGFDLRYMIFVIGATVHIYLPCRYAAKIKFMSTEVADRFYCSGWEKVHDQSIRKMVLFMIARSQVPIEISAFNMVTFDMELFLSMMQTSYSMFTLLRS